MKTPLKFAQYFLLVLLLGASTAHADSQVADNRSLIKVDAVAKEHVLLEMRQLLESVQLILDATLKNDMEAVNRHASRVGLKAMRATPSQVASQLPKEFKMMGRGVHEAMDSIARDAKDLGDSRHAQEQLNSTLQSCVACHQTFKFQ